MLTKTKILGNLMKLNAYGHSYPFKVVAFVKYVHQGQEFIAAFPMSPKRDLQAFIDRITNPIRPVAQNIDSMSYRFTTFHKKIKGSKEMTMDANPEYLISHSMKRGFFDKRKQATLQKL